MIDGNANDFLDKLYYEDHYIVYKGEKFFINGCQTTFNDNQNESVRLEVYDLTKNNSNYSAPHPKNLIDLT